MVSVSFNQHHTRFRTSYVSSIYLGSTHNGIDFWSSSYTIASCKTTSFRKSCTACCCRRSLAGPMGQKIVNIQIILRESIKNLCWVYSRIFRIICWFILWHLYYSSSLWFLYASYKGEWAFVKVIIQWLRNN